MMMKNTQATEKDFQKFGFLMTAFFAGVIGLLIPLLKSKSVHAWPLVVGLLFVLPALFKPSILKVPYELWMKLGRLLGAVNSRIILSAVYYSVFVPMGLVLRLLRKDTLDLKFDKNLKSYRKECTDITPESMKYPF